MGSIPHQAGLPPYLHSAVGFLTRWDASVPASTWHPCPWPRSPGAAGPGDRFSKDAVSCVAVDSVSSGAWGIAILNRNCRTLFYTGVKIRGVCAFSSFSPVFSIMQYTSEDLLYFEIKPHFLLLVLWCCSFILYSSSKSYFGLRYEVLSKFIIFPVGYTTILIEQKIIFYKFICMSICFQLFCVYTQAVQLRSHIVIQCLTCWGTTKLLSTMRAPFYLPYLQSMRVPMFPHPHQHLYFTVISLFAVVVTTALVSVKWYIIVALNFISLMANYIEYLFM